LTSITGTSYEDLCTFMVTSRSVLLRIRNVSDEIVVKIKTHFVFSNIFLSRAVFETNWKHIAQPGRPQVTT